MTNAGGRAYGYEHAQELDPHLYLRPALERRLAGITFPKGAKGLDFGSGNGALTAWIAERGLTMTGVDISESGVGVAQAAYPHISFSTDTGIEHLRSQGPFDLVTSLEVLPHTFRPREELAKLLRVMAPGAVLVISTPYHGYLKLLALAALGRMEAHLDPRWSGAHMHFFTPTTLKAMLTEVGFLVEAVDRVGRIAPFAKSMLVTAKTPS